MSEPAVAFTGLTGEICATAWTVIQPAIVNAATLGLIERRAGCMVVLPPTLVHQVRVDAEPEPVFIGFLDGTDEPELYSWHALAKARVSWQTGLPSREISAAAHLYRPGMTRWGGSVIRDGLVCAFSGVQPVFDEMIAGWMADTVIACCRQAVPPPA